MSGDRHVGGASPVMSARTVVLSVILSLLVLLPSLSAQYDDSWTSSSSDQYPVAANGPSDQSNNKWSGANPPGHNKWGGASRGSPGGHNPPGLAGGFPPGLSGKRPPGWNKADNVASSEGENLPNREDFNNRDGDRNRDRNTDGAGDRSRDVDGDTYRDRSTDGERDRDRNRNGDVNRDGDRYGDRNKNGDRESDYTRPNNRYDNDNINRSLSGPDGYVPDSNVYSQNRECRDDEYRCRNNECVPQRARCDNKADCRDSSDEEDCFANRHEGSGCALPEQLEGGHYQLQGCESRRCSKRPGDPVPLNSILTYSCKDNYVLSGNTISACVNNEWYEPPSCNKVCPSLNSTTVDITCSYQGETVSCSERIQPGTRAALACKSSYKLPVTNDPAYREITCLEDGLWDQRVFRCLPECGTSIARGNTLIVNGFEAKVGKFPWHVGIYAKKRAGQYEQICGGTLINNNLVVSAAHCFYDEVYNKPKDASNYAVAAGKHSRNWDTREEYAQKSIVESIRLTGRYIGARGNFAEDIALLKLSTPFELTTLVRPVCMDWDNMYEREQLQVGRAGKVAGWGKDIKGESTRNLQEVVMPFVPYQQCLSAVPVDFRGYITSDKFCAGRLNGSSVCEGDSGGGLSFEKNGIWYLRGIVSVSPVKGGGCDYNSYVGFTSISHFRDWIREAYVSSDT